MIRVRADRTSSVIAHTDAIDAGAIEALRGDEAEGAWRDHVYCLVDFGSLFAEEGPVEGGGRYPEIGVKGADDV